MLVVDLVGELILPLRCFGSIASDLLTNSDRVELDQNSDFASDFRNERFTFAQSESDLLAALSSCFFFNLKEILKFCLLQTASMNRFKF